MPIISANDLEDLLRRIYVGKGLTEQEASIAAEHQVSANLVGHDSHGAMRTLSYVKAIEAGQIVSDAAFVVEHETPSTFVVDGSWGLGFAVTQRAMDMAIAKAAQHGVVSATIRRQSHIGRLGHYAERAAKRDMIAMMMADSGMAPKHVAPYGGARPRLGTNPICIAAPDGREGVALLDMATSSVAMGKIHMARNKGVAIPEGWILDKEGRRTTEPRDYYDGGTLLPLGGDQGYKGYGLSFMIEMLCGLLTGLGFGIDPQGRHNDGVFITVINVANFLPPNRFRNSMNDFVHYLKETPTAVGFSEVLIPGELEQRTESDRRANGIDLDGETWEQLHILATSGSVES